MTIAKRPQGVSKVQPQDEAAAQRLVEGAPHAVARDSAPQSKPKRDKPKRPQRDPKERVMVQIDSAMLVQIDREAERCGLSRSAWLVLAARRALDEQAKA
jgi:uncharacterized protein (DUF4415 family)